MTIVGAAELTVSPVGGSAFSAELLKIAEPAGAKAGEAAGRAFAKSFAAAQKSGVTGSTSIFGAPAEAGKAGQTAGRTYAEGFTEGVRINGATAIGLGGAASAAEAESQGLTTGRLYGRGFAEGSAETSDAGSVLNRAAATSTALVGKQGGIAGKVFGTAFGNAAVPIAAVVLGAASVKLAGDFEQQTNVLVTAAGEQQKNLGAVQSGIKSIAVQTGTAWQQVTAATYTATKAGFDYAHGGLDVVRASAQGAREENASLATVTTGVTTALTDYHLPASDAIKVTDELKTAAGQAKTNFEGFTGSLGAILPRAAAVGVSLADVTGVLDSVTQAGVPVQQGAQNIGQTLKNLSSPLGPAITEMGQLGINVTDVVTRLGDKSASNPEGRGLAGTLNYLSQTVLQKLGPTGTLLLNTFNQSTLAAGDATTEFNALGPAAQKIAKGYEDGTVSAKDYRTESRNLGGEQSNLAQQFLATYNQAHGFQNIIKQGGPAAQSYINALSKLVGGQQGVTVALAASGGAAVTTAARIKDIGDSAKVAGSSVSGWATTQHNFNTELGSFKQEAEVTGIDIGTDLLPPLKAILGVLTQHPAVLKAAAFGVLGLGAAWATVKVGGIISDFGTLIERITGIGAASAAAAPEVAALGGAEGLGSVESGLGRVGGAATATGGAFASSGLLLGGAAILGIGGLALAVNQLVDAWGHIPANLPNLDALALSIGKTGKTSAATTNLVATSLSKASSGNNRGESQGQAFERITSDIDPASKTGATLGADYGLSLKSLFSTIETGTTGSLAGFLSELDRAERATGANNDTVQKANDYYTGLFNRFNSGRAASASVTKASEERTAAALAESTNVKKLSSEYGISALSALALASENKKFEASLVTGNSALSLTNSLVLDNSKAGTTNKFILDQMAQSVEKHAATVLKDTGSQTDSNAAFKDGITQIETNAEKLGFNKQQVDALIGSLDLVPPKKNTDVTTTGTDAAEGAVLAFLGTLNDIPAVKTTVLQIVSAFSNPLGDVAGINLEPGAKSNADGAIYPAGKSGGIYQWAEAGGEAFIPLAPSKRARSTALWAETGKHLGVMPMADGGVTGSTGVADYLKALAKQAAAVAKISVTDVLKIDTKDITGGSTAIAAAVKEGNGPLQNYIGLLLKAAQGNLYTTGLAAVKDGKVSPAEAAAVNAQAKQVTTLTATLTKLNTVNAGLVTSLNSFVSAQSQFRDTLQSNISTGAGFSDLLKLSGSPSDLQGQITANLADVKGFAAKIAELKSRGFSDAIIRDVANDGITQGTLYADLLLTSTKAQVKSLDSSFGALTAAELGTSNAITASTAGTIPGLTKAAAGKYIEQAIFTPGADTDSLVNQAEYAQRTGAVNVTQNNTFQGVDLATAYAQSTRQLSLALQKAGV